MSIVVRHFRDLTVSELYDILRLRVSVFMLEQQCLYEELDGRDLDAMHVFLRDSDGIAAYLRVLDRGVAFDEVAIGRVIAARRRCGLGTKIMRAGIEVAQQVYGAQAIELEAQVYAQAFYERLGFRQVSAPFLEDGIMHIRMRWEHL